MCYVTYQEQDDFHSISRLMLVNPLTLASARFFSSCKNLGNSRKGLVKMIHRSPPLEKKVPVSLCYWGLRNCWTHSCLACASNSSSRTVLTTHASSNDQFEGEFYSCRNVREKFTQAVFWRVVYALSTLKTVRIAAEKWHVWMNGWY